MGAAGGFFAGAADFAGAVYAGVAAVLASSLGAAVACTGVPVD